MKKRNDERISILMQIKKNKVDVKTMQGGIKYELPFEDSEYILTKLGSKYINIAYNNPLPKSDKEICGHLTVLEESPSIMLELKWYTNLIIKYSKEINIFLDYQLKLENEILQSNINGSFDLLDIIEAKTCHSLYLLQCEMLINELNQSSEENTLIIKELTEQEADAKLIISLELARVRIDEKQPAWQYDSVIAEHKKNYSNESAFIDYVDFKFDPAWHDKKLNNISFILGFDSDFSIIDRYLTLKGLLPSILSQNELSDLETNELFKIIDSISQKINDPFWNKVSFFLKENINVKKDSRSDIYYNVQDLYLDKNYKAVIQKCAEVFILNLNYTELYLFFVKSLMIENQEIENYINKDSYGYKILNLIKNVLAKNENYIQERDELLKIFYSISHLNCSHSILELLFNEYYMNIPKAVFYNSLFNIAPIRYNYYNHIYSENKIKQLSKYFPENKVFSLIKNFIIDKSDDNTDLVFSKQLEISCLIHEKKYDEGLKKIEKLIQLATETDSNTRFFETWCKRKSLKCYIENKNFSEAANLIVDYYFETKTAFDHFFDSTLANRILEIEEDDELNNVSANISIPILFQIYKQPQEYIYDSIAYFLIAHDLQKPSDLIKSEIKFENEKLVYFFENVCVKENITDSPFLNTIELLENERISILNHLKGINPIKLDIYNEEILKITKESSIRKGLMKIHESRIYIDTNNIKKIIENSWSDVFKRYINITDLNITDISTLKLNQIFTKEKNKIDYYFKEPIDEEFLPFYLTKNNPKNDENAVLIPHMRYLYFISLFDSIKNLFIYDESYGFKSFLSMRIRHGTFSNVLRSIFEKHKIVSSMESHSLLYQDVKYWDDKFNVEPNKYIELQNLLKKFSEDIDLQIENGLSWININSKDSPSITAIFNFEFNSEEMKALFQNRIGRISSFNDFIEEIFKILYERLEQKLSILREKISTDLNHNLVLLLNDLQSNIQKITVSKNNFNLLEQEIVRCRTEIQIITSQIIKWFKVSYNQYIEAFPIEMILRSSIDYIDAINTSAISNSHLTINNSCSSQFNGKYFESFGDIFINIFDNIISKNKDLGTDLIINVDIKNDEDILHISVKNNVSSRITETELLDAIKVIVEKVNNYDENSSVGFERGSGYLKICKSISAGLGVKKYKITPTFIDNFFEVKIEFEFKNLIS